MAKDKPVRKEVGLATVTEHEARLNKLERLVGVRTDVVVPDSLVVEIQQKHIRENLTVEVAREQARRQVIQDMYKKDLGLTEDE